jgi:hypothetical protein
VREMIEPFDEAALIYRWKNADARVDDLSERLQGVVSRGEKMKQTRAQIFEQIEDAACDAAGVTIGKRVATGRLAILEAGATIPYLNEPWYCCAEPTGDQLASVAGTRTKNHDADAFV